LEEYSHDKWDYWITFGMRKFKEFLSDYPQRKGELLFYVDNARGLMEDNQWSLSDDKFLSMLVVPRVDFSVSYNVEQEVRNFTQTDTAQVVARFNLRYFRRFFWNSRYTGTGVLKFNKNFFPLNLLIEAK
jgi:hypothetical protein